MQTCDLTYRERLAAVKPLIDKFHKSYVTGGTSKKVPCPACKTGVFSISKEAGTGTLSGFCTTAFCVNFSEAS